MRSLLIIVIILNMLDAFGAIIRKLTVEGSGFAEKLGGAVDAALLPLSIVVIATAVLRLTPVKKYKDK